MSQGNYEGISVREAMEKINAKNNGWFLPNIQRQYVWGSRDSSEEYICLLVDSLFKGFPIGGLVLWETDEEVPYRNFLDDYETGFVARIVPKESWANHKSLVYDGQQRLQTLHSVLYHRFNHRVLYYDLLFDSNAEGVEFDDTGFFFKNTTDNVASYKIAMPELVGRTTPEDKVKLRRKVTSDSSLSEEQKLLIESNLDQLWSVFVSTEVRSIAYFPVRSNSVSSVNEVFRRLNTGGVSLTQVEMVLAKVKEVSPYFEEALWALTEEIKKATGTPGYDFTAHEILQLIYLEVFCTSRVEERRVNSTNAQQLIDVLNHVKTVLPHFFKYFLHEMFHINAKWLIMRQQAMLPMLAYFVSLEKCQHAWEPEKINTCPIITYFIKSQLCDWNTQTMVTAFSRLTMAAAETNKAFPLDDITKIAVEKNRTGDVYFYQLEGAPWFSLKILTPGREYLFNERTPQIDHIYPKALKDKTPDEIEYRKTVDVLWNFQPTPAGVNNYKRCKHPVDYFSSPAGRQYLASYDFLPDLSDGPWLNASMFVSYRKGEMVEFLMDKYGIELKANPQ